MSRWIDIENKWRTETTYRIREFLKEKRIPMDSMKTRSVSFCLCFAVLTPVAVIAQNEYML